MVTATRTRKVAKSEAAADPVRAAAKAQQNGKPRKEVASAPVESTNGAAKVSRKRAGSKFAPDQPTLPTPDMKKVDERIKALDDACQQVLSAEAKKLELATELRELNSTIGELLSKHGLGSYIINGEQFFKKPSGERVVHQKLKLNG